MKVQLKAFGMFLTFICLCIIWFIGIFYADLKFFIIGACILTFLSIFVYKNQENLKILRNKDGTALDDERNQFIKSKAGYNSFEIMMAIIVFAGVCILTLRNIYPEYINIAYTLFLITVFGFTINRISLIYYKRKYD